VDWPNAICQRTIPSLWTLTYDLQVNVNSRQHPTIASRLDLAFIEGPALAVLPG
jgi:hypothetical protein